MKRFEQMERRRLEQTVAPNIDGPMPAPVRGPVHADAPNTRLPDLTMMQTALHDAAKLTVQLVALRKNAQDKADTLAQIEFDGWVKSEQTRLAAEFSQLPLAEQQKSYDNYQAAFASAAKAKADELGFSPGRRQIVGRMISSLGNQFGARMYAESTRALEQHNIDLATSNFRSAIDNGDVAGTGEWYDRMIELGCNPGTSRDQAISRAVTNNLIGQLDNLAPGNLKPRIDEYDRILEAEKQYYDIGDGRKISRRDLIKVRDAADKALYKRERDETDDFISRVVDGSNEYTLDDLKRMHDDGLLSDRQFTQWTEVLKAEEARAERAKRAAASGEPTAAETGRVAAQKQAALLLRCELVNFSANEQYRIRQVEEFRKLAVGLFADDPKRLRETLHQIDRISTESSTGKSAFSTPLGQRVKNYLLDTMKQDPFVHSQEAISRKYGAEFARLSPEVQEQIMARQYALYDMVKQMVLDGRSYLEIKKVIDEEASSINSAAVEAYLKTPARSFVYGKTKDGTVWAFDAKTKQPLFPVKSIPQGGNK